MRHTLQHFIAASASAVLLVMAGSAAQAAPIYWTDWTGGDLDPTSGFQAQGTITTGSSTVTVTYTNANGIAFYQPSGGIDYYQNARSGRDAATSPYTSSAVDNIPTGTDIIALRAAGMQTLQFSQAIANPVFSYVSLNGNGYAFDQDFEILSFGNASDGNSCGYWGCGTSTKNVVDLGGGNFEYQLLGTGEPHGTLRFLGAFDTVSWRSLTAENWNGFTVGVQGTAAEVFQTPEPGSLALMGLAMVGLACVRRRRR
ncbi:PEP-CTERM sorting domain-containing protein [Comamonadaceae bacterium G21597-S1]|nr:PEP-CTERM sorting domain-containing protein [Comamonadaceae bacterium G21597-S1]